MPEPTTKEEYEARYHAGTKVVGFGAETSVHHPCPFCAAPDWLVCRVLMFANEIANVRRCMECGRSARGIVTREGGGTKLEIVQTGGPPPAAWLPPIRRV